jgi:hypothetical protein
MVGVFIFRELRFYFSKYPYYRTEYFEDRVESVFVFANTSAPALSTAQNHKPLTLKGDFI